MSAPPRVPSTVSTTRHVEPSRRTGWVRPGGGSDQWHMLHRFDSAESLGAWEGSTGGCRDDSPPGVAETVGRR